MPSLVGVARAVGALSGTGVVLLCSWVAYWTYLDPRIPVPAPKVARFEAADSPVNRAGVLFLGDFAPTDAALPALKKHGYAYPFDGTRSLIQDYDVAIANLEAPITTSSSPSPRRPPKYVYKIHPDAVPAIGKAGIDAVTLANNHAMDYGRKGLGDTISHLEQQGILHTGAHLSEASARQGLVFETPGGRVGVLAYMENKRHWRLRDLSFALDAPFRKWPGVARLGYRDLIDDIDRIKRYADIVVVAAHFGANYKPVTKWQKTLGRAIIDLGAHVVIGHHPHTYQPVEIYRGRPIVYSLGNYAFGTRGRRSMRYGMGVALHIRDASIENIEIIPLFTQNRIVRFQPRVPRGKELDRFFEGLVPQSERLGARIVRRGDRGWLGI